MTTLNWKTFSFDSLSVHMLYAILKLRTDIFVVEQNCPYPELDGKDIQAFHVVGIRPTPALPVGEGEKSAGIMAYARVLPPGVSYKDASIGRVVIHPSYRGKGLGKELMKKSLECALEKFGKIPVRISAQAHLQKMYEEVGFKRTGEEYLEDDIPHVEMVREIVRSS